MRKFEDLTLDDFIVIKSDVPQRVSFNFIQNPEELAKKHLLPVNDMKAAILICVGLNQGLSAVNFKHERDRRLAELVSLREQS